MEKLSAFKSLKSNRNNLLLLCKLKTLQGLPVPCSANPTCTVLLTENMAVIKVLIQQGLSLEFVSFPLLKKHIPASIRASSFVMLLCLSHKTAEASVADIQGQKTPRRLLTNDVKNTAFHQKLIYLEWENTPPSQQDSESE